MSKENNRREFIKMATISGLSLGMSTPFSEGHAQVKKPEIEKLILSADEVSPNIAFVPGRIGSWWNTIEDLQWSQKKIVDRIKRKAAAFAEAEIDTAINHGFHVRFDFSNYFGQLHGYMANVSEELHQYGIRFMDHYTCNHVERPRNDAEFKKLQKGQRHHILLFHDPIAAKHAQYEGHLFHDLCEVDIRDGSRGYGAQYQFEAFCHNNPAFLDMHVKYLKRLLSEVPIDGFQVDDMCDYAGLTTCGCTYCRERFKRDYGQVIPPFENKSFWGDTSQPMLQWGNYENPAFRDFLRMKTDGIVDHIKIVKNVLGDKPMMTCCSSSGPLRLNAISLDLEKMAPFMDFFMLENAGTSVRGVDWLKKDAEALHQKDMAKQRGNVPAMALSSTIYKKGAYLGWSLSRFWGVANWCSTLQRRLEEDPVDALEVEDVITDIYQWEVAHSNINYYEGDDLVEARLVSNRYCRENGWVGEDGKEHWERVAAWSALFVKHNIGYRFVRAQELSDLKMLLKETTPLVLDGVGCVSDSQFKSLSGFLSKGGKAWMVLPFGTHDEKGFKRNKPLSDQLLNQKFKHLHMVTSISDTSNPLEKLISAQKLQPVLRQISGDKRWAARIRMQSGKPVLHFMNRALIAIPHPTIKDNGGVAILKDIDSAIKDNLLVYEIDTERLQGLEFSVFSPELGAESRTVSVQQEKKGKSIITVNLDNIKIYAVLQGLT